MFYCSVHLYPECWVFFIRTHDFEFFICNLNTLMCEMYEVNMVVSWEK